MEQDDVIEVYQEQTGGGADEGETEYIKLKVVGATTDHWSLFLRYNANFT